MFIILSNRITFFIIVVLAFRYMRKTPKTDLHARHWAKAFEAANLVTNYSHVSEQHYPKYSFSNPALFMFWTADLDTQIVHLEEHYSTLLYTFQATLCYPCTFLL